MNNILLVVIGIVICTIAWSHHDDRTSWRPWKDGVKAQSHTGLEVKRWLELNPHASLEEIERKVKDIEIQQPYISRPVIKMKESTLSNVLRQYPKETETAEYLVIVVDSSGTVKDIGYQRLATVFPLDVYFV